MELINWLICKFTGHDDNVEKLTYSRGHFVSLAQCARCGHQWWMLGEHGHFRNVRFVKTDGRR